MTGKCCEHSPGTLDLVTALSDLTTCRSVSGKLWSISIWLWLKPLGYHMTHRFMIMFSRIAPSILGIDNFEPYLYEYIIFQDGPGCKSKWPRRLRWETTSSARPATATVAMLGMQGSPPSHLQGPCKAESESTKCPEIVSRFNPHCVATSECVWSILVGDTTRIGSIGPRHISVLFACFLWFQVGSFEAKPQHQNSS